MREPKIIALPLFAPLPVPMVLYALQLSELDFMDAPTHVLQRLHGFLLQVEVALDYLYPFIAQEVRGKTALGLGWFREHVAAQVNNKTVRYPTEEKERRVYQASYHTITSWRQSNLLLPPASRAVNPDRAAAILAVSMIDERRQGFLPPAINPWEPHTWCFSQAGPHAPLLPCPLPAPPGLPPQTILFMRWPTFEKGWTVLERLGSPVPLGALRFAELNRASLEKWDERFASRDRQIIYGRGALQMEADRLFHRLGPDLFASIGLSSLPVVYDWSTLYQALTTQPMH